MTSPTNDASSLSSSNVTRSLPMLIVPGTTWNLESLGSRSLFLLQNELSEHVLKLFLSTPITDATAQALMIRCNACILPLHQPQSNVLLIKSNFLSKSNSQIKDNQCKQLYVVDRLDRDGSMEQKK
eukprot:scpid32878/ scgid21300/ 